MFRQCKISPEKFIPWKFLSPQKILTMKNHPNHKILPPNMSVYFQITNTLHKEWAIFITYIPFPETVGDHFISIEIGYFCINETPPSRSKVK